MSTSRERMLRRFSEEIKREQVSLIDSGKRSIAQVSRELEVSRRSIYCWLKKYSLTYQSQTRIIVEKKSYQNKVKELEARLKEVEAALGRKQIELEFLEKLVELSEQEHGIEIRKKGYTRPLSGSDKTDLPEDGG